MATVSETFTAHQHPLWNNLNPEEQAEIAEWWVDQRMQAHGNLRDERVRKQLLEEAYKHVKKPQKEGQLPPFAREAIISGIASTFPASPIASHLFGVGPKALQERGAGMLRTFELPRELMWRSFKKLGEGELPPLRAIGQAGREAVKYVAEGGKEVELPEQIERLPLSFIWTDPTIFGGMASLVRAGLRRAFRPRVRPPLTPEEAQAFNIRKGAEEAARRRELRETIAEIKGEEGVGAIKPLPPLPRPLYNKAMPKLTPHFIRDEARKVAEFVARHPDDPLSRTILGTKGSLPQNIINQIEWRLFGRGPLAPPKQPPIRPTAKKAEAGKTAAPPKQVEELTLDTLTKPGELAKELLKMAD